VEIMLTSFIMLHIRTESYGKFCAPQPSVKTDRQNLGDGFFSGMIMLEIDSELNTNIVAYEILHPLTRNENFMLMTAVLSDSESCHE
jgi:hypothetical protein